MARNYCEDERVIGAFLNNFRTVDIIRESGLGKTTVYKLKNNPEFQAVIRQRKDAILQAAVSKMQSYIMDDVETIQAIINNPEVSPQVRINAVNVKWSHLREWVTTTDILKRLADLQGTPAGGSGTV